MLIASGGSLGGARPKASVVDEAGYLYITKFPSIKDEYDVGGWETVVSALTVGCGLNVAPAQAYKFAGNCHCLIARRFGRINVGRHLYFASVMTPTRHQDGEDASTGASYLGLVDVLIRHGARTNTDFRKLWPRIVFNTLVSNTGDHLRNHGYILIPGRDWRLFEICNLNPIVGSDGLKLNVTENSNALDLELAREVARYFRLGLTEADDIIANFRGIVSQWRIIAERLRLPGRGQELTAETFRRVIQNGYFDVFARS